MRILPTRAGIPATSIREICGDQHRDLDFGGAAAAYGFSRYVPRDKHLFFWLLSNRMAPASVYALPFFNLYSAINLFDTPWAVALAHCISNVPLAVWILKDRLRCAAQIDETAFLEAIRSRNSSSRSWCR